MFQGDINTEGDTELQQLLQPHNRRTKRNALRWQKRLWTSRVIPYVVPSFMGKTIRPSLHFYYESILAKTAICSHLVGQQSTLM